MKERLQEALRTAAAEFLSREANRSSLITVTGAQISDDGKRGKILMTVYPDSAEEQAVEFANRHRTEFGEFFKKRVKAQIPLIEFVIDMGEKNRQRLDELSQ